MADATNIRGERLARRLFGNYAFQIITQGVRLFEQLLLVPLYIFAWGTELYKDWLIVTALVWLLYYCSLGTDEYFGNLILRSASMGDRSSVNRQVKVGLFIACLIPVPIFAILYGVLLTVGVTGVLAFSSMDAQTAALVLVVMTVPLWCWFAVEILRAPYRAYGEFSRGECIFAIFVVTQLAVVAAALVLRQPPVIVAFCYGGMYLLYSAVTVIDVCRRYPAVSLGIAIPTRDEWRRLVPQSLLYFTNSLSAILTQNAILFLFGLFDLGAKATVSFNVFRIFTGLTRQVGAQSFAIGSGIEMARQHVQNDHEACRKLYADTGRIVSCLAGVLSGLSIPFSGPFVALWTHGAVTEDKALVVCFLAGIFLSSPGRASLMLLRYTNNARAIAIASCTYSIGGLLLAMALAQPLGGFGMALALAIAETLAMGLYPPLVVGSLFHFSPFRHLLNSYFAGLCAFALSYAVARVLFLDADIGILGMIVRLAAWTLIVLPPGVVLILPRAQRSRLFAALRRRLAPLGLMPMG